MRGALVNVVKLTERYGDPYLDLCEVMLTAVKKMGTNPEDAFLEYIYHYVRDLGSFQKTGKYDNGSFEEIKRKIYDNENLMMDTYLPGLFLGYGFTLILHEKFKFFEREFASKLRPHQEGCEIGFGDGFYLWCMLRGDPAFKVSGFDISPHAIEFSRMLFARSGISETRYQLAIGDLNTRLDVPDDSYDWTIMAEVIEHVADPAKSMQEMRRIMRPGGLIYMATVKDSNHMDHITNFDSVGQVIDLLHDSNFEVRSKLEYRVSDDIVTPDKAIGLGFVAVCRK